MEDSLTLSIEGNEYLLKSVSLEIRSDIDRYGKPISEVNAGRIWLELDIERPDAYFAKWALNQEKKDTIQIIYSYGEFQGVQTIIGENVYLVEYSQKLDIIDKKDSYYNLVLSMEKMKIEQVIHENNWE